MVLNRTLDEATGPLINGPLYQRRDVKQIRAAMLDGVQQTTPVNVWLQRQFRSRWLDVFCEVCSATVSELFLTIAIPLVSLEVGPLFACHLLLVFTVNLYISNTLKCLLQLPRPDPTTKHLYQAPEKGYGFPSTHASSAIVLPFYALYFFPLMRSPSMGLLLMFWCASVVFSRLYLGVHSLMDVVGGLVFGCVYSAMYFPGIMGFAVGLSGMRLMCPLVVCVGGPLLIRFHPPANKHDNDESVVESTAVIGASMGALLTMWHRSHWDVTADPLFAPMLSGVLSILLRFVVAVVCTGLTKVVSKLFFQRVVRLAIDPNEDNSTNKNSSSSREAFDTTVRLMSYTTLAFVMLDISPLACVVLGL